MNDEAVVPRCGCDQSLDTARREVLELAQHAGLNLSTLAGLVNKSAATLRRWLREPDIHTHERITLLVQACIEHSTAHARPTPPAPLLDPHHWRQRLHPIQMHHLFGTCPSPPRPPRTGVQAITGTMRPLTRQIPALTTVFAIMLFAYALTAHETPARRAPRTTAASDITTERQQPPAADRTGRTPMPSLSPAASDTPATPTPSIPPCPAFATMPGNLLMLLLCYQQDVLVLCCATPAPLAQHNDNATIPDCWAVPAPATPGPSG
ncbi:hypothetical protein [Streptomyces sp. f51]|uniref:hypothetical protein n=1 Tax=Streptomyces sp. f51 TaxID=1827742 RepID=UPI000BF09BCE|nr:hypothetical protein [Streptomyces sp. f51]